jgi:hypothetical protein
MSGAVAPAHLPAAGYDDSEAKRFERGVGLIDTIIKRENELASNRFGWFLTAQSALFAALGLVFKFDMGKDGAAQIPAVTAVLGGIIVAFGIAMAASTIYAEKRADDGLRQAEKCWNCLQKAGAWEAGYCVDLFPVKPNFWSFLHPHHFMPVVALAMWVAVAVLLASGSSHWISFYNTSLAVLTNGLHAIAKGYGSAV